MRVVKVKLCADGSRPGTIGRSYVMTTTVLAMFTQFQPVSPITRVMGGVVIYFSEPSQDTRGVVGGVLANVYLAGSHPTSPPKPGMTSDVIGPFSSLGPLPGT